MKTKTILSVLLVLLLSAAAVSAQARGRPRGNVPQPQDEPGLLVAGVISDSPAERAGLMRGDILLSIEGTEVDSVQELRDALNDLRAGQRVKLEISRGGKTETVNLTLEDRINRPIIGIEFAQGPRAFAFEEGFGPVNKAPLCSRFRQ